MAAAVFRHTPASEVARFLSFGPLGAAMALRTCRKKGGEKEPARETELGDKSGGSSPVV